MGPTLPELVFSVTAREELKALAETARRNARDAKTLYDEFTVRADSLETIVNTHTDQTCEVLLARLKKECAGVWPS